MVKVPSGMTEADLARPVVVITDFETGKLEYEIYSYGEETVVIPVRKNDKSGAHKLAEDALRREFQRLSNNVEVDVVSANKAVVYVAERDIAKIIGKQGKNIDALEKELGISIEVREFTDAPKKEFTGKQLSFNNQVSKKSVLLFLDETMANKDINIFAGEDYLMTAKSGKNATINISRKNKLGKIIADELASGKIRLVGK